MKAIDIKKAIEHISVDVDVKKTIIVLSKFWMKWLCEKMQIPYRKKIDTGCIIYVEQVRLKTR